MSGRRYSRFARESVPNSLRPPPEYEPELTRMQRARAALSDYRRRACGIVNPLGRPLSPRSVRMLGEPCPGSWESEGGYNNHACRCERCRAAASSARLARMHREAA